MGLRLDVLNVGIGRALPIRVRVAAGSMAPSRSLRAGLVAAAAAALVLAAPPAAGASVTLGPDLTTPGNMGYGCQQGQTCSFVHLPGGAFTAAAPYDGVITRWRFRAACCIPTQTVDRTATL